MLYYGYGVANTIFTIIAIVFALAAAVLAAIFILPKKKRENQKGFFGLISDFINFKTLYLETILKCLYIFLTCFSILYFLFNAFITLFRGGFGGFLLCLLYMVIAPIVIRLAFEFLMMFILLVSNVQEINRKLGGKGGAQKNAPAQQIPPEVVFCPNCGTRYDRNAGPCPKCGTK